SESEPRIETVWGRGFQFVASVAVEMKPSPPPLLEELEEPSEIPAQLAVVASRAEPPDLVQDFGPLLSDLYGALRPVSLFASTRPSADVQEISIASVYTAIDVQLEIGLLARSASATAAAANGGDAAAAHAGLREHVERALQGELEREVAALSL